MGKLYIGDYIYITDKEISLHEVKEINGTSVVEKTSSIFNRNAISNYLSSFTADIIFGFEVFPIIVALLKIITLTEMPIYAIVLLFINLWLMMFAFYMLGLSLNSRQYIYHNILNALLLYGIIKIIFAVSIEQYNLLEVIVRNVNYWTMNLYMFIGSLITIIISLALKFYLNFSKMNRIIYDFCKLPIKKDSIITIGKFDSVHRGHQKLIKYTVDYANKNNLISIAIVIKKKNVSIYNTEDNNTLIKSMGINYIIVIDFLPEFYTMEAKEFFDKLIEYYRMKHIAVGADFAFGKDRMGDSDKLQYKRSTFKRRHG